MSAKFAGFKEILLALVKGFCLLLVAVLVLLISQQVGPMSKLHGVILVDERYLEITRDHFIFLGITNSMMILIAAIILRISLIAVPFILFFCGVLQYTAMQAGDPDFITYYVSGLLEFLLPYCASAAATLVLYLLLRETIKRAKQA